MLNNKPFEVKRSAITVLRKHTFVRFGGMKDEEETTKSIVTGRLLGKITACLAVFAIILIWGWRTEYEFRRSHHPPPLRC